MAPKDKKKVKNEPNHNVKATRTGDGMMKFEMQASYIKRQKLLKKKEVKKKKDRLRFLKKKETKQLLSSKEKKEKKDLEKLLVSK